MTTEQPNSEQPATEFDDANADRENTIRQTELMLDFLENCAPVPAILIDIDGVILDNTHRLHHIVCVGEDGRQAPRLDADWTAFHGEAHKDTPGAYVDFVKTLVVSGAYVPVFLTARVEIWTDTRATLMAKINEVLGLNFPDVSVIMRERKSMFPAPAFKDHIVQRMLERGIKIGFALDDSHQNCLEFRARGIPTFRAYNHLSEDAWNY